MKNYYKILQVDSEASQEVITAAYKRLARFYHPDVNHSSDAEDRMKELNEAYGVLRDTENRQHYDYAFRSPTPRTSTTSSYTGQTERTPHSTASPNQGSSGGSQKNTKNGRFGDVPLGFPTTCSKCGVSNATLRWAGFRYAVSLVVVTFRRGWGGLYCEDCRKSEMGRAKLITLALGWWGIPFGVFFTLGILFSSNEGDVPAQENADYLKGLGINFLNQGRELDAQQAFRASLALQPNPELEIALRQVFGTGFSENNSNTRASGSAGGPDRSVIYAIAILAVLFSLFWVGIFSTDRDSTSQSSLSNATQVGEMSNLAEPPFTLQNAATSTLSLISPENKQYSSSGLAFSYPNTGELQYEGDDSAAIFFDNVMFTIQTIECEKCLDDILKIRETDPDTWQKFSKDFETNLRDFLRGNHVSIESMSALEKCDVGGHSALCSSGNGTLEGAPITHVSFLEYGFDCGTNQKCEGILMRFSDVLDNAPFPGEEHWELLNGIVKSLRVNSKGP